MAGLLSQACQCNWRWKNKCINVARALELAAFELIIGNAPLTNRLSSDWWINMANIGKLTIGTSKNKTEPKVNVTCGTKRKPLPSSHILSQLFFFITNMHVACHPLHLDFTQHTLLRSTVGTFQWLLISKRFINLFNFFFLRKIIPHNKLYLLSVNIYKCKTTHSSKCRLWHLA